MRTSLLSLEGRVGFLHGLSQNIGHSLRESAASPTTNLFVVVKLNRFWGRARECHRQDARPLNLPSRAQLTNMGERLQAIGAGEDPGHVGAPDGRLLVEQRIREPDQRDDALPAAFGPR